MMRIRQSLVLIVLASLFVAAHAFVQRERQPALPAPAKATKPLRDTCANYWTLVRQSDGTRQLLVLRAQAATAWEDPKLKGVTPGAWRSLHLDEDGYVWLLQPGRSLRFDPRQPEAGAVEAMLPLAHTSQTSRWQVVAQMPATNHDLTAAVLGDKFYVGGGLTAEWGFPARSRAFDELWELNTRTWQWRVAAQLNRARIYCATAAFDNKVWVIGGDVLETNGDRHTVTTVELFDQRTGKLTAGPATHIARPMPLALVANQRLYVMGNRRNEYEQAGLIESIGLGENTWRREPDGPPGMGPLSGTALDDKLYVLIPKRGLAIFDALTNRWELIKSEMKPRSCQMAAFRGEIWLMGGRDIADMRQTLIFNPHTRVWHTGPPLPLAISWGAAATVQGRLIVTGGAASRQVGERQYVYNDRTFVLRD